jgi:high affinity sulfate transporter 1
VSDAARPAAPRPIVRWARRLRPSTVLPIIGQLRGYRADWLGRDVAAGLAVGAVALPIGIAYPDIAGLPPAAGLYASILALLGYALFGSSRQLMVGPDAATLTVLAASLSQLAVTGADQRVAAAAAFAIVVGLFCLLAASLRLGFVASFLSRPVLTGYLCGVSLSLLVGQITRLTTIRIESPGLLRPLLELARRIDLVHMPTLLTGLGAFVVLRLLKRVVPRSPGPLVALALATAASVVFDLQSYGVPLLGQLSSALPRLVLPPMPSLEQIDDLILSGLGIFVVSYASGIITARSFGAKNRYRVDPDRELAGFGAANIASGLFAGFPVTGADSRTAINDAVGGRTQVTGLIAALALVIVIATLTEALRYLPIAALGAVLASAAIDLFDLPELRRLWRTSRAEFLFALIAMAGVITLGVLKGVVIAIGVTLVYLLARAARPRDALLGRIPGQSGFYKLHSEPRAKPVPGLAIYLVQGSLVFFNCDYIGGRIRWVLSRLPPTTRWFILDAEAITTIDSTAVLTLEEIRGELARRQVRFGLAKLHSQPRRLLDRAGLLAAIGADMLFESTEDAARAFEAASSSESL